MRKSLHIWTSPNSSSYSKTTHIRCGLFFNLMIVSQILSPQICVWYATDDNLINYLANDKRNSHIWCQVEGRVISFDQWENRIIYFWPIKGLETCFSLRTRDVRVLNHGSLMQGHGDKEFHRWQKHRTKTYVRVRIFKCYLGNMYYRFFLGLSQWICLV